MLQSYLPRTKGFIVLLVFIHWLTANCLAQEFEPMFNGRDLTGWVLVNTPPQTWNFESGMLVCSGKPIGEIRTEKMYQNFEMEIEWRHMVPGGNAGIFVWADDITARGVPFHRGVEVQVLENAYGNNQSHTTHGDIFPIHGAKMKPINGRGGDRAFPTEERSLPSPQWNHYRIVCNDGTIALSVNGKEVTKGIDAIPRKGYICLESEGGVVHYRNARIRELPDTPIDPSQVAIANRGYRSIYTGLDLSGWEVSPEGEGHWKSRDWVLSYDGKTTVAASKLKSNQQPPIAAMVIDFRFVDGSKSLHVHLPEIADPIQLHANGDPQFAPALQKTGSWNRMEIVRQDSTWKLTVNGTVFTKPAQSTVGSIAIASDGPIELANLFVRP